MAPSPDTQTSFVGAGAIVCSLSRPELSFCHPSRACRFALPATQYTFPKDVGAAVRENVVRAPGPGHYNIHPGVGKQVCACMHRLAVNFSSRTVEAWFPFLHISIECTPVEHVSRRNKADIARECSTRVYCYSLSLLSRTSIGSAGTRTAEHERFARCQLSKSTTMREHKRPHG